jgi:hypothetical protein
MTAEYNPNLFTVKALVGDILTPVNVASLTYSASYDPDDNGTLIVGSETVRFSISGWGAAALLQSLSVVEVKYDGIDVGCGRYTVDTSTVTKTVDPTAARFGGQTERVDCQCSAVGKYAAALDTTVTFGILPTEPAIIRIRRWVTVTNWDAAASGAPWV